MVYCSEMQMACEYANIGGGCSLRACAKMLFTPGGWVIEKPKFVMPKEENPCDHCMSGSYRGCDGCSYGERKDGEG